MGGVGQSVGNGNVLGGLQEMNVSDCDEYVMYLGPAWWEVLLVWAVFGMAVCFPVLMVAGLFWGSHQ